MNGLPRGITWTERERARMEARLKALEVGGGAGAIAIEDIEGLQTALDGKQPVGSYAASSHSHSPASASSAGFLAAADKEKLDGIEAGATADQTGAEIVAAVNAQLGSSAWQSTGPNFTLCTLLKPAATAWITNAWNNTAFTTQAQVAGRSVLSPFLSSHDVTIDQIGVSVATGVASALFKVVIYAADANGRPTTVLAESGTLDGATPATRTLALASPVNLAKGALYWIGVRSSSTATLRCLNVGASPQLTASTAATPVGTITLIRTGETFADPATAWTYANSQLSNALAPLVLLRVA